MLQLRYFLWVRASVTNLDPISKLEFGGEDRAGVPDPDDGCAKEHCDPNLGVHRIIPTQGSNAIDQY